MLGYLLDILEIFGLKEDEKVNAKSIMGVMMLAAAKGTILTFSTDSSDSENFEQEMTALFNSKFQDE